MKVSARHEILSRNLSRLKHRRRIKQARRTLDLARTPERLVNHLILSDSRRIGEVRRKLREHLSRLGDAALANARGEFNMVRSRHRIDITRENISMNETETLIRSYFDAFNRHDAEGMLATLHDDVRHDINEGGSEIGKDAFRRFKAHMDECYREQISDLVVMTAGNRGAAEFTCSGAYLKTDGPLPLATGQTYAIPAAAFFEVADGKIVRVTSYYNLRNWIKAVD